MNTVTSLQGKRVLRKTAAVILMAAIGVVNAAALILVGVGGVLAKALAIVMTAAAGLLFFCTSFSGGNAATVILTATALFWLPELAGVLLVGLIFCRGKSQTPFWFEPTPALAENSYISANYKIIARIYCNLA